MALIKLAEFYPNYRQEVLGGDDVKGIDVYAGKTNEKIGTVWDDVIDLTGRFRYLVIDTSFWGIRKKVLIPVGSCRLDYRAKRIYAIAILNKKHVEELPEYADGITVDYNYREQGEILEAPPDTMVESSSDRSVATDELDANEANAPQTLNLYEERAIANKSSRQTGEVAIGKRVVSETTRVSIPIKKERIVIERSIPADVGHNISPEEVDLCEGEVARIKIYEEIADIQKAIVVREVVTIRKEIEPDTIDAEVTLRHEELEIHAEGEAVLEKGP